MITQGGCNDKQPKYSDKLEVLTVPRWIQSLRARWKLQKNRVLLVISEQEGKRYLAVCKFNWRGKEWTRWFEIVDEVDEEFNKLPFRPNVRN